MKTRTRTARGSAVVGRSLIMLSAAGLLCGMSGCGEDPVPATPVSPSPYEQFDEELALAQASPMANQAASILRDLPSLVTADPSGAFGLFDWNAAAGRWEHRYGFGGGSFSQTWEFRLTFLADAGAATMDPRGAQSAQYEIVGRASVTQIVDGVAIETVTESAHLLSVSDLGGETFRVLGGGEVTIEIHGDAADRVRRHAMTWTIGTEGFSFPAAGECPRGTAVCRLAPYTGLIETGGDGRLSFTLLDVDRLPVPDGTRSRDLGCSAR